MRRILALAPLLLLSACAESCSIAKALYGALVHNSGAPPSDERDRIEARGREFLRTLPTRRVTVVPVVLLGRTMRYDTTTAASIAAQLTARGLGTVTFEHDATQLPFEPQPNELAIFLQRFNALAASAAARPRSDVDYVMLIDVFGAPARGSVGAVHVMVVTAQGEMAYLGFWNSHQALYKEIQPRSLDDVARMVVTDIARRAGAPSAARLR
jgi:hypothetical protein